VLDNENPVPRLSKLVPEKPVLVGLSVSHSRGIYCGIKIEKIDVEDRDTA